MYKRDKRLAMLERFYWNRTDDGDVPAYVVDGGKTYIDIRVGGGWRESQVLRIRQADVADYYADWARNITSGIRMIAGFADDWRGIDTLAQECLSYFKYTDIDGMRRAVRRRGLIPRF